LTFIYLFILVVSGVASAIGIPFLRETYAPVLRMRNARKAGDLEAAERVHPMLVEAKANLANMLWVNLTRPIVLLFRSFICFILSLFMAL